VAVISSAAIEHALVEAFAGAYVSLCHLNAQLALGQPIDLSQHAQCVGAMVRVASRLGLKRQARDVTPTLNEYLQGRYPDDAEDEAAESERIDAEAPTAADAESLTSDREAARAVPSDGEGA